jgi:hypothetical protein
MLPGSMVLVDRSGELFASFSTRHGVTMFLDDSNMILCLCYYAIISLLANSLSLSLHYFLHSINLSYLSQGMHLEQPSKSFSSVSSPSPLRILHPPLTQCVKLFVHVGERPLTSPSSSLHSVPTSS